MAKGKNSFLLYRDLIDTVEELSDEEAGQLFKHVLRYVNDQNPETPNAIVKIAFLPIKSALNRDLKKYRDRCQKNKDNAKKRWSNSATASGPMQSHTKNADTDIDTDIDIDIDTEVLKNTYFENIELDEIFKKWLIMCKEKGKTFGPVTIEQLQKKIETKGPGLAIPEIAQSIEHGWFSLHPVKEEKPGRDQNSEKTKNQRSWN